MIKLFTFQPYYFNNNGDQGNLDVLTYFMKQQAVEYKNVDSIEDCDFALLGDASIAVMQHYEQELGQLRSEIVKRHAAGAPTLLVGSTYEYFAKDLGMQPGTKVRFSGFLTTSDGVFGYQNSDSDLPAFYSNGLFMATNLFGPLLAKNPKLLVELSQGLGFDAQLPKEQLEWIGAIRKKDG